MADLEYDNPNNAPRTLAVRLLDLELAGSFTPDRAIGYAILAVADQLKVLNDTLNEMIEAK